MLKLTFVKESALPGGRRPQRVLTGGDASEILEQWNRLPAWNAYTPLDFRQGILELSGSKLEIPMADDEILDEVVRAVGPHSLLLEETGTGLRERIAAVVRRAIPGVAPSSGDPNLVPAGTVLPDDKG